jgi:hypothetical protein
VRSSERIEAQPNADVTQMERAQQNAQACDDFLYSGHIYHLNLLLLLFQIMLLLGVCLN